MDTLLFVIELFINEKQKKHSNAFITDIGYKTTYFLSCSSTKTSESFFLGVKMVAFLLLDLTGNI